MSRKPQIAVEPCRQFALPICFLVAGLFAGVAGSQSALAEKGKSSSEPAIEASFASKFKRYREKEHYHGELVKYGGPVTRQWTATAWKGERIHCQFVLWSRQGVKDLECKVTNFNSDRGTIDASRSRIRQLRYVKGDQLPYNCAAVHEPAVKVADVLTDDLDTKLPENTRLSFWITIDVPSSALASSYEGKIEIKGRDSNPAILDISLEVLDLELPNVADWKFHLDLWQFPSAVLESYNQEAASEEQIEFWSDDHLAMLEPFYRHLADAGQKTITTYIKDGAAGAPSMVRHVLSKDGKTWAYDYTAFDRYVDALHSFGVTKQISAFSLVGWNKNQYHYWDDSIEANVTKELSLTSREYYDTWTRFLSDFRDHLEHKGWFEKTVLFMDEVPNEEMESVIQLIKSHDPRWKIGLAYGHLPSDETLAQLYDASGILGRVSQDDSPKESNRIRTFYTSCTQLLPNCYVTPHNSPAEMTWMAWHAAAQEYDGYLRWAYDYWRQTDPWDARDGQFTAGDFAMIYRSSNDKAMICQSSIRFELLREGIQDFEKILILKSGRQRRLDSTDRALLEKLLSRFTEQSGIDGKSEFLVTEAQTAMAEISKRISSANE